MRPRTFPRPLIFTMYMRASAAPIIPCTAVPSSGAVARPTLALTFSFKPVLHLEMRLHQRALQRRRQSSALQRRSPASGSQTRRHHSESTSPACGSAPGAARPVRASNSLPTRCPCASFTSLNRSRSRNARLSGTLQLLAALQFARPARRRDGAHCRARSCRR